MLCKEDGFRIRTFNWDRGAAVLAMTSICMLAALPVELGFMVFMIFLGSCHCFS